MEDERVFDIEDSNQAFEKMHATRSTLNKALCVDESFWTQKAWVKWWNKGDRNSRFFIHWQLNERQKQLFIKLRILPVIG